MSYAISGQRPSPMKAEQHSRRNVHRWRIPAEELLVFRLLPAADRPRWIERVRTPARGQRPQGSHYLDAGLSAVGRSFRESDPRIVEATITALLGKYGATDQPILKDMYRSNVALLQKFKTIDPTRLRPAVYEPVRIALVNPLLPIGEGSVEVPPTQVFSCSRQGVKGIGATWLVARKGGYTEEETSLLCELLHRFLQHQYAKRYPVHPEHCRVADLVNGSIVDRGSLANSGVGKELDGMLGELLEWMSKE